MVKIYVRHKNHDCNVCIIVIVISLLSLFPTRPSKNGHFIVQLIPVRKHTGKYTNRKVQQTPKC
jgi:hypothetical protein